MIIIMRFPCCVGVHIHSNRRQNLPGFTLASSCSLNFTMQYHKPHQIRRQKRDKEVANHELSTVHRSCEACEKGHVHPPLEMRGQHIERPRSTLSPEVGKPAEIWTPDKAIAVAKQLANGTLKRPCAFRSTFNKLGILCLQVSQIIVDSQSFCTVAFPVHRIVTIFYDTYHHRCLLQLISYIFVSSAPR